jgi:hypothetical protein
MGNRLVFLHWGNRLVFFIGAVPSCFSIGVIALCFSIGVIPLCFSIGLTLPRTGFKYQSIEDDVWPNSLLCISVQDKENVLRQAKLLKGQGISITEDISNKAYISGSTHLIFSTEFNQRIFRSSKKRRRHFVSHKNQYWRESDQRRGGDPCRLTRFY